MRIWMHANGPPILALEHLADSPPGVLKQQGSWSGCVSAITSVTLPLLGYGQC